MQFNVRFHTKSNQPVWAKKSNLPTVSILKEWKQAGQVLKPFSFLAIDHETFGCMFYWNYAYFNFAFSSSLNDFFLHFQIHQPYLMDCFIRQNDGLFQINILSHNVFLKISLINLSSSQRDNTLILPEYLGSYWLLPVDHQLHPSTSWFSLLHTKMQIKCVAWK